MSLQIEIADGIAVLTIDRQPQRNALDDVTMRGTGRRLRAVGADDDVRVLVLTAAGEKAFSSGVDLAAFAQRRPTGPDDDWYALASFAEQVYPKPIIGAANGVAVAGGLELLLNCDLIVAAEHASFGIPR